MARAGCGIGSAAMHCWSSLGRNHYSVHTHTHRHMHVISRSKCVNLISQQQDISTISNNNSGLSAKWFVTKW